MADRFRPLDGRPVTTHWMHAAELARHYPAVRVDPGVLVTGAGPDGAGAHPGSPLTVTDLARRAGMNERTFTRHVKAATGTSPLQWLLSHRLRRAEFNPGT